MWWAPQEPPYTHTHTHTHTNIHSIFPCPPPAPRPPPCPSPPCPPPNRCPPTNNHLLHTPLPPSTNLCTIDVVKSGPSRCTRSQGLSCIFGCQPLTVAM